MEQLLYSSVETIPNARASVAFTEPKPVFKEDSEITQTILSDTHCYMLRVGTNQIKSNAFRHHRSNRIGRHHLYLSDVQRWGVIWVGARI